MKLNLGTICSIIKHNDCLIDLLRGGNEPQMMAKLQKIIEDPHLRFKLMNALDEIALNVRVVKCVDVNAE